VTREEIRHHRRHVIAASSSERHRKEDPKVEAVGSAQLTDRIPAHRAVAANFSRREIRDVLHEADATPELTLEVVAGDGSREHGRISMTWSRDDLEKLLAGTSGDDVVLTFDRNELMAALDDVEAHGVRSRAAVFAVAALGALGTTAGIANASMSGADAGFGSGTTSTAPAYTDVSTGGYATPAQSDEAALSALQARSEALDAQYAGGGSTEAMVTDASTGGGYVTPGQNEDAALSALQARSEALDAQYAGGGSTEAMVTDASTGGYTTPAQSDDAAALQARSHALDEEFGLTPADQAATRALETRGAAMNAEYGITGGGNTGIASDAATGGGYPVPTATDTGGGFSIQAPSTDEALIAGAALLAIAGAGFAARRGTLHLP
jgi:hypothetical protein